MHVGVALYDMSPDRFRRSIYLLFEGHTNYRHDPLQNLHILCIGQVCIAGETLSISRNKSGSDLILGTRIHT
jgi:hypothetical protein